MLVRRAQDRDHGVDDLLPRISLQDRICATIKSPLAVKSFPGRA